MEKNAVIPAIEPDKWEKERKRKNRSEALL